MTNISCRLLLTLITCLLATGCQQVMHAASRTPLEPVSTASGVVQSFNQVIQSTDGSDNLLFNLCSTKPTLFECTGGAPELNGKDFGLMPVKLTVDAIELENLSAGANGWAGDARLRLHVNGIDVWCRSGKIHAIINPAGRSETSLDSAFCNWLLIGNAQIKLRLSIEEMNPESRAIAGFYTLHSKGTTVAEASGYFLARAD